jgi:hypothetical protein
MKTIDSGVLVHSDGHNVSYEVGNGWSPDTCAECDEFWGAYTVEFFNFLAHQGFSGDELAKVLVSMQTEDSHWNWSTKAALLKSEGYEWFYLIADGKPQGVCVIYHPKESVLSKGNIFYVKFLSVAPWNRDCSIRKRQLKGVGTALLRAVLRFSVNQLKLGAGFSLHSLPQAVVYYQKLKMVSIKEHDDGVLSYFELPADLAIELMRVA